MMGLGLSRVLLGGSAGQEPWVISVVDGWRQHEGSLWVTGGTRAEHGPLQVPAALHELPNPGRKGNWGWGLMTLPLFLRRQIQRQRRARGTAPGGCPQASFQGQRTCLCIADTGRIHTILDNHGETEQRSSPYLSFLQHLF